VGVVLPILFFLFVYLSTASCAQYRLCLFISPVLSWYRQTTELRTLVSHLSSLQVFIGGSCYSIFSFMCMFCGSLFVLLYCFLLDIVLSVLRRYTDSNYRFSIFWTLYCLFFVDIRILITASVSFGHCVVCSSSIYGI